MDEECTHKVRGFDDQPTYPAALQEADNTIESAEDLLYAIMWEEVDPVMAATEWLQKHAPGLTSDPEQMASLKQRAREAAAKVQKPYAECLHLLMRRNP